MLLEIPPRPPDGDGFFFISDEGKSLLFFIPALGSIGVHRRPSAAKYRFSFTSFCANLRLNIAFREE
jgi:hypothetical protein